MASPTKLEQSLEALCKQHDLTVINIQLSVNGSPDYRWTAYVHWEGFSADGNSCDSGNAGSPSEAINKAIATANINRNPPAPAVTELPDLAA